MLNASVKPLSRATAVVRPVNPSICATGVATALVAAAAELLADVLLVVEVSESSSLEQAADGSSAKAAIAAIAVVLR